MTSVKLLNLSDLAQGVLPIVHALIQQRFDIKSELVVITF